MDFELELPTLFVFRKRWSVIKRILQVQIRNFKSIAQAVVDFEPFTALVGPNGAGKSNFIDALAFVQECLSESMELAFKKRGGTMAVRRRSGGHPTHLGMRIKLDLDDSTYADYSFEIAAKPKERFRVAREKCEVAGPRGTRLVFDVHDGTFSKEIPGIRPKMFPDRLALFAASATEEFRPIYDFLTSMRFYSIVPSKLRELQEPDPGDFLKQDGSNAAAILKRISEDPNERGTYELLCRLLTKVVEGLRNVEHRSVGQKETVQFKQDVGLRHPWTFDALNMSDGTLRALGLLLAIYQIGRPTVVTIEEPEATVHPAVAELVIDVLLSASQERQIIITTHSPDILDYKELTDEQIRAVIMKQGKTKIAPLSQSSREAIRNHLYTPGELLRSNELNPDLEFEEKNSKQLRLFGNRLLVQ